MMLSLGAMQSDFMICVAPSKKLLSQQLQQLIILLMKNHSEGAALKQLLF